MIKRLLLLIGISVKLFSMENLQWSQEILWEENLVKIEIKAPMDIRDSTLSSTRIDVENSITDNFTNIFLKGVLNIDINSLESVADVINREPGTYFKIDSLGESLKPTYSTLATNLEYLSMGYEYRLYPDLVEIFYSGSENQKVYKSLDHLEYGYYTGLIIYVENELPLYRKGIEGELTKVLFPKIYNEEMEIVVSKTMIEPEYMKKWGMVIYSDTFDEEKHISRIGISPLRVVAKELFGKNNSDIIISREEGDKLLGNEKNLGVITQGRILIIHREK